MINQITDLSCILDWIAISIDFDLSLFCPSIWLSAILRNIDIFTVTDVWMDLMYMDKKFRWRSDALVSLTRKASVDARIRWNAICYKWLSCSQLEWFTATILFAILKFVIGFVSNFYIWCGLSLDAIQWEKKRSHYLKPFSWSSHMWHTQKDIQAYTAIA